MAVYNENNFITREELCDIFFDEKDPDTFYDIFESDGASPRFDRYEEVEKDWNK